jgi:hypothetical protein
MKAIAISLILFGIVVAGNPVAASPSSANPLSTLRRVNAPHFSGNIQVTETAIAWFGRVTSTENYADIRVGYTDQSLWFHVNIIDRRVWYDTAPSVDTLTNWDSVTLYLDKRGNTDSLPTADSYRIDAQVNFWGEPRDNWQTTYRGNGATWASHPFPLATYSNLYGDAPNTDGDDHGWQMTFDIPFESLGLSGAPPAGTIWGLGLTLHDRDSATGPMEPDESWPENMSPDQPLSWEQLHFGLPEYTVPTPTLVQETSIIRQGLNGAAVQDAVVGGNTLCGGALSDYFVQWGNLNYAYQPIFNVQNVQAVSEWPCFSKEFVTFPLTSLPAGKAVISATLTLYHFGNPGPAPESAFIQLLTVNQDWDENTITWNNAPLARENLGGVWIPPIFQMPPYPGIPYTWDVSCAAAEAYSAGQPLRLALYSASSPFHNGRYFHSSEFEDTGAISRPTLRVVWGEVAPTLNKTASPLTASFGQPLTYTLTMIGTGRLITVTDDLPDEVSSPGQIQTSNGLASYSAPEHRVTWTGTGAPGQSITVTYPVTVLGVLPTAIVNRATLIDSATITSTAAVTVIANGRKVWLPLILDQ